MTTKTHHATPQPKKRRRAPEFLAWTVQIRVHKSWVADGFDCDDERALDMLSGTLPYANIGCELRAKVLSKPDAALIRKLQGYDDSEAGAA